MLRAAQRKFVNIVLFLSVLLLIYLQIENQKIIKEGEKFRRNVESDDSPDFEYHLQNVRISGEIDEWPEEKLQIEEKNEKTEKTEKNNYKRNDVQIVKTRIVDSGTICFLHVAKSAGTAFTEYLTSNFISKSRNPSDPNGYYFGNHRIPSKHFDWSSVESLRENMKEKTNNFEVITLLREPVSRGISHFNFIKRDRGWASKLLVGVSLEKLFGDLDLMMQVRGLWQDGQASVSWLSGTHIGQSWVKHEWSKTNGLSKDAQLRALEEESLDFEKVLSDAAARLDSCTWIGLKERLSDSIELLNFQFPNGIKKDMKMTSTANKLNYEKPGENVLAKLKALMPLDIWLYEYAADLFNARWTFYKTGKVEKVPDRPPFPKITCKSTRYILMCYEGPFGRFVYRWPALDTVKDADEREKQEEYYQKWMKEIKD